jgi:hypothetical protein
MTIATLSAPLEATCVACRRYGECGHVVQVFPADPREQGWVEPYCDACAVDLLDPPQRSFAARFPGGPTRYDLISDERDLVVCPVEDELTAQDYEDLLADAPT